MCGFFVEASLPSINHATSRLRVVLMLQYEKKQEGTNTCQVLW